MHAAAFPTNAEARLVDALRSAGQAAVSLVALVEGEVAGHVFFSRVEANAGLGVGLAPLAVQPLRQRKGIGLALVQAGIAACRKAGFGYVVVLGDPGYYGRFGFVRASSVGLGNEYGADAHFLVLELRPGALARVRGMVKYAAEFSQLA